jgi:DNA-binding MarR family transcriptional regulator
MPAKRTDRAYEVTWLVRRLFRAMGAKADEYLASANLSAAERAVMEFLYPNQEMSVPDIARRYKVSRQHVQVTVNGLLAKGLLRSVDNPQHKRSHLSRLSGRGRQRFDEIRRHELTLIEQVFADIPDSALATTHETLSVLLQKFK